ncbi:MAG TPA: hypothetical protein VK428_03650 [Acidimicrobiales bacterium]|nr:hypothetical protein [Acidimicrobiales bacterium]
MPAEPGERRHVLGFRAGPNANRRRPRSLARPGGGSNWIYGPVDRAFFRAVVHPLRSFRRWRRHRRLGPYDVEDGPEPG